MVSPDPPEGRLQTGQLLADKYRILHRIGRGGMAEVYAATHEILRQTVAIKILRSELATVPEVTTRFLNEARAMASIRGEHIAAVMDVGSLADGSAYMVMEYLEGRDLEKYAEERAPIPVAEAVDHVLQALQAIAQAHALGIVHRDIKPSNLFLARQPDGSSIVKVLDFGISKAAQAPGTFDGLATATATIIGSPHYMAPEQARSSKSVDTRADVWAIGAVLYLLLAGRPPFTGESLTDLLLAISQDEPRPLREHRAAVPEELEGIVARCLSKQPAGRFQNVAELAAALQSFGGTDARRAAGRVMRTLSVHAPTDPPPPASPPSPANPPSPATPANPPPSTGPAHATAGSWAESSAGVTGHASVSRARLAGIVLAVAVACAVAIAVGRSWVAPTPMPVAAASSASPAPASTPADPAPATTLTTATATEPTLDPAQPAPSASASAAPPPPIAPPTRSAASVAITPRPGPTAPAKPARPPATSCDPPYTTDAKGHVHIKPGCQ